MPVQSAQPSMLAQFQQGMYVVGSLSQVAYWIGILVIAILAYRQLKRVVDAGMIAMKSHMPSMEPPASKTGTVNVDEFVE